MSPSSAAVAVLLLLTAGSLPHAALAQLTSNAIEIESARGGRPPKGPPGGKGDPLISAFDGSLFFFHGEPGKIYNLASLPGSFQVSTLLKEANNAVHTNSIKNGTYMQAIGFKQGDARVVMETFADDSARLVVKVNDQLLQLDDAAVVRSIPLRSGGAVDVAFKNFATEKGTLVTIRSPDISLAVYLVPPGLDHAGFWQPSYLNIEITLLAAPTGTLQGVIGDTFHFNSDKLTANTADDPSKTVKVPAYTSLVYPVFPDVAYELPSLFAPPTLTFPASFIHETIVARKAAVSKLLSASTTA